MGLHILTVIGINLRNYKKKLMPERTTNVVNMNGANMLIIKIFVYNVLIFNDSFVMHSNVNE